LDTDLLKKSIDSQLTMLSSAKSRLSEERKFLKSAKRKLRTASQAQTIIQEVAKLVQNNAHKRICSLVTQCLKLVFDDPYTFTVRFEKKRNKTEASFLFLRGGDEFDPDDSIGGGVLDIVSFALRLSSLCMRVPPRRRVMVLDEPFKFVSNDKRGRVADMLMMLSEKLEIQFIITTHSKRLRIGKIYEID
jgi:DNA repair exonuclease SbcCD ATPase subunit